MVPLVAFRPEQEAAIPSVARHLETLRGQGHEVHVRRPGAHGSSTLLAERAGGDVSQAWDLVMDFLARVRQRHTAVARFPYPSRVPMRAMASPYE